MTEKNIETLRNLNEELSAFRVYVVASENNELDPIWDILFQAGLAVQQFAYDWEIKL